RRDPGVVLMPDVAFSRAERLPEGGVWEGTVPIAPDFAAEVASPNDTMAEIRRRGRRYLDAGVRLVWLVWPRQRAVSVLRQGHPELLLTENDELDGGDVVPGFRMSVAAIFAD